MGPGVPSDLQSLQSDVRFQKRPAMQTEIGSLQNEVDQFRGIKDLLSDAELAYSDNDWERLFSVTTTIFESGKVGQFSNQVGTSKPGQVLCGLI